MEQLKNKTIAVDFDGVLVKDAYPKIGEPNEWLIEALKKLYKDNTLILWTCRNGDLLEEAVAFLEKRGLKFHYVNENSDATLEKYDYVDSRKITADIYLDDKSLDPLTFNARYG